MQLTIFGATGRTGLPLVEQALAAGHTVTAFVRDPAKLTLTHAQLRSVAGDVRDPVAVSEAVAGADAVISALGHTKQSPADLQTVATRNIIAAMQQHGVRRLVSLTGGGVRAPQDQPKLFDHAIRFALATISGKVLRDAVAHAELITASDLDWVIVRGPMLIDGPYTGNYRVGWVGLDAKPQIARADVADFMLKQATNPTHLRQMPMLGGAA
jgi:putative NADH-flavin reductase